MRFLPICISVLLLAAGAGCSAYLLERLRSSHISLAILGAVLTLVLLAYFATGRQEKGAWVRFGLYGAAMMICAASIWMEIVRPVLEASSFPGFVDRLTRLSGYELALIAVPPPGFAISFMLWFEVLIDSFKYLESGKRRQRAESDLYGKSKLLGRRFLRRLAKRRGILLGQWGAGRNAKLIGWSLEGSAITVAPPRVGKGALIALNLLSPGDRGFQGSTVTIDPRGELWCIAARRRRELGRRVLLIDPFRVVRGHKKEFEETHLPDVESASYNPLDFIRDDESLAVRDINVLLDALLTPPRPDAHNNSRHFYESARAIVAGYMAWVRFQELPELCNLAKVYEMLSMSPKQRETFADRVRDTDRFAGGLTHIAIERQAQVGKEEGGSNFTTVANQLAFLNYPELRAHTQTSSFDPLILADGDTDLFVVAPEETIEHVKGWLRLWVAIPNAVAGIKPLKRDLMIVIDEMPRLGYLKPVMDGYTMAAGKGVHFWCFAQSISALDSTWGKEHRKTLLHLAELVQILGFPRTDAEGAEELSKAIGTATFEARTENRSGTIAENRIVTANTQWQAGESRALVRERLITPDELMTLAPTANTSSPRPRTCRAMRSIFTTRATGAAGTSRNLADPNPFVIRKATRRGRLRKAGVAGVAVIQTKGKLMTGRTSMELDGREAAGSSLEPESGAIAEPHWLWEAIAAAESPVSVEMEDAGDDPNGGPDTGNGQKGDSSAALSGDDQREDSAPGGIGGEFAKLRTSGPAIRGARGKRSLRQTGSDGGANENAGRGRGSECSRAAGVRRCRRAATRSRRNRGTAEGREPDFHGRLPSLGRRAARVSPLVVGACAGRRCSGLLPAWRIGRVAVPDYSRLRSERRLEPPHLGPLRPCHRRLRDGSKADGPGGEVFARRS